MPAFANVPSTTMPSVHTNVRIRSTPRAIKKFFHMEVYFYRCLDAIFSYL